MAVQVDPVLGRRRAVHVASPTGARAEAARPAVVRSCSLGQAGRQAARGRGAEGGESWVWWFVHDACRLPGRTMYEFYERYFVPFGVLLTDMERIGR